MKLLHGIDLTNIDRVEFKTHHFEKKILSEQELIEFYSLNNKEHEILYLAKHWCMKEAIIKAVTKPIAMNEINILKNDDVYKTIVYGTELTISTSRQDNYIVASAFGLKFERMF